MAEPKKIYALADMFLAAMEDRHMLRWAPEDYGDVVTDDHRLYCWNEIVDMYGMFPEEEIDALYDEHVTRGLPMDEMVSAELNMEEALVTAISEALEMKSPVVVRVNAEKRTENKALGKNNYGINSSGIDPKLFKLNKPEYLN